MLFKEFGCARRRLSWARIVEKRGRIPLLIEGDDGTRLDRRSIVNALRVGMREQVGGSSPLSSAYAALLGRDPVPLVARARGERGSI